MKRISTSLFILFSFCIAANAQQVRWLQSHAMHYQLNPGLPQHYSVTGNGKVFGAHIDSTIQIYGNQVFGFQSVDCRAQDGNLLWSFPMTGQVYISRLAADHDGNTYIAGAFMETAYFGTNDSLENTGVGFNVNVFMISLDVNGQLRWKRNVTVGNSDIEAVPAFGIDPAGNCWYVAQGFEYADIYKLDGQGNDANSSYLVNSVRSVSSISFDAQGNMFVAGSVTTGTFSISDLAVPFNEFYGMFVARINANGHGSWVKFTRDVTFQSPEIMALADGHAYFSGNLMDSTAFGSIQLHHPQWVYDIFLTRLDSTGNFQWALQIPTTPTIEGDFQRGMTNFLDADQNGNVYLTGTVRGKVDWGNGVISKADTTWDSKISIVSFDANGTPRWGVSGGCYGFNVAMSVAVAGVDLCYFGAGINAEATFDTVSTNTNGLYAYLLGKIGGDGTTNIEIPESAIINIYPNPASENMMVALTGNLAQPRMEIFNSLGELVYSQSFDNEKQLTANISSLTAGIYFVKIADAKSSRVVMGKFVKG